MSLTQELHADKAHYTDESPVKSPRSPNPLRSMWGSIDGRTRSTHPSFATSAHNTEHQIGTINSGALFRTFPTALPTFQVFISSAGYGLNRSTGRRDGSPGSSHRW